MEEKYISSGDVVWSADKVPAFVCADSNNAELLADHLNKLESELAASRADNTELRKWLQFLTGLVVTAEKERDDARAENQVLREAFKSILDPWNCDEISMS